MSQMPRMLTIAGSDSGGGAGIQADLRTAALLGCHGASAITAVTAQNSTGVQGVFPLPPETVSAQIRSVLGDIGADAAKTGMLFSAEIIRAVAEALAEYPVAKLVVDPVMVAKGGAPLLREDARHALIREILPLAALVTPNLPEAEALAGAPVGEGDGRWETCRRILDLGPRAVLLKGGHAEGEWVEDLYADAEGARERLRSPRIPTRHTHGTGCTLSAAIAAHLARGWELPEAVARAHTFLHAAIRAAYPLGRGHGPTNPYAAAHLGGRHAVLERLWQAWDRLEAENPAELIPEVQSNLAEALPGATEPAHVAAFPGRMVRCGGRIRRLDGPRFGASRHLAALLLAAIRGGSPFRAVMNVRFGRDVLEACRAEGLVAERLGGGEGAEGDHGSGLGERVARVSASVARAPDVLYIEGGTGLEPMVCLFGSDALEVAERVTAVSRALRGG
ncbi:MAG: bifunctional hydroxymethylpyrimidine kinase/phosphomethylpyrimidine kinase [Deferrisomatales bacterium]